VPAAPAPVATTQVPVPTGKYLKKDNLKNILPPEDRDDFEKAWSYQALRKPVKKLALTIPETNYVGPFNDLSGGEPTGIGDVVAMIHDFGYADEIAKHGSFFTYSMWNAADQKSLDTINRIPEDQLDGAAIIVREFLIRKKKTALKTSDYNTRKALRDDMSSYGNI